MPNAAGDEPVAAPKRAGALVPPNSEGEAAAEVWVAPNKGFEAVVPAADPNSDGDAAGAADALKAFDIVVAGAPNNDGVAVVAGALPNNDPEGVAGGSEPKRPVDGGAAGVAGVVAKENAGAEPAGVPNMIRESNLAAWQIADERRDARKPYR